MGFLLPGWVAGWPGVHRRKGEDRGFAMRGEGEEQKGSACGSFDLVKEEMAHLVYAGTRGFSTNHALGSK